MSEIRWVFFLRYKNPITNKIVLKSQKYLSKAKSKEAKIKFNPVKSCENFSSVNDEIIDESLKICYDILIKFNYLTNNFY